MKKLLANLIVVILMVVSVLPLGVQAADVKSGVNEKIVSQTVEYFEDGSYATVTVTEEVINTRSSTFTKTGQKSYTFKNGNGQELWKFTVKGTFSVEQGISATCTSSKYAYSITDDVWELETASATRSSNKALGSATFVKKVLFITADTRACSVTLTCDKNGNLS